MHANASFFPFGARNLQAASQDMQRLIDRRQLSRMLRSDLRAIDYLGSQAAPSPAPPAAAVWVLFVEAIYFSLAALFFFLLLLMIVGFF